MITVLLVTRQERLRMRRGNVLPGASIFLAPRAVDALHQLRHLDVDLVVWEAETATGAGFLDHVREVAPACVTVAIGAYEEGGGAPDFIVAEADDARRLE